MKWIAVEDGLPEYAAQVGGQSFVCVFMADKDGGVWAGDYTDGKFFLYGIEHPHVTHWMHYPDPPNTSRT
jgi:hypothetical protein